MSCFCAMCPYCMSLTTPSCAMCPRLPLQAMADDEAAAAVQAILEGNEEVVQLQVHAGNISSGRPPGQCAKEQGGGGGRGIRVTCIVIKSPIILTPLFWGFGYALTAAARRRGK